MRSLVKAWNTGRLGSCREADHFCLPFWNSEGSEGEDSISGGWKAGLLLLLENLDRVLQPHQLLRAKLQTNLPE